jgi:hypothetical protein
MEADPAFEALFSLIIGNRTGRDSNDNDIYIAHLYMWIYSKALYMCEMTDCYLRRSWQHTVSIMSDG